MSTENPFDQLKEEISEIKNILLDHLKKPLPTPEPPDRIGISGACSITGLSKAAIYKYTHLKKLPHLKFGRRLVFSRRQIEAWVDDHTVLPVDSLSETMNQNLKRSAKKHLRHGK